MMLQASARTSCVGLLEQRLELGDGEVERGLREVEHGAHPHADERRVGVGGEVARYFSRSPSLAIASSEEMSAAASVIGRPFRRRSAYDAGCLGTGYAAGGRRCRRVAPAQAARCSAPAMSASSSAAESSRPKAACPGSRARPFASAPPSTASKPMLVDEARDDLAGLGVVADDRERAAQRGAGGHAVVLHLVVAEVVERLHDAGARVASAALISLVERRSSSISAMLPSTGGQ